MDKEAEPFYRSITGMYEVKEKPKNLEEWKKADTKQVNKVLEENDVPKRIIETDGSEDVYPKWFVRSLVAIIFILIAGVIIAGVFVYKYKPTDVDVNQPINTNVTVNPIFNSTTNNENAFNLQATTNTNATVVIQKVEVNCYSGGCIAGNSS